jgi:hypothetical protein
MSVCVLAKLGSEQRRGWTTAPTKVLSHGTCPRRGVVVNMTRTVPQPSGPRGTASLSHGVLCHSGVRSGSSVHWPEGPVQGFEDSKMSLSMYRGCLGRWVCPQRGRGRGAHPLSPPPNKHALLVVSPADRLCPRRTPRIGPYPPELASHRLFQPTAPAALQRIPPCSLLSNRTPRAALRSAWPPRVPRRHRAVGMAHGRCSPRVFV